MATATSFGECSSHRQQQPRLQGVDMTTTSLSTSLSTSRILRRSGAALVLAAAVAVPVFAAGPASAQGGSPAVKASGSCVGGGVWKLKAKHDNSRVEIEYEVDTNRVGQPW